MPKRRPLRNLWRRIRRKKTEEPSEPEPEQPPLKVGESVVVEATGRSGKVSLVAANGWCQVTYDDEECEGQTETLQCPDLVREEAALAETIDAEVSDFDEILIKWGFKEDPRIPEECRAVHKSNCRGASESWPPRHRRDASSMAWVVVYYRSSQPARPRSRRERT